MGIIVSYDSYIKTHEKKVNKREGKVMLYGKLIEDLQMNPASNYTVQEAEKLAEKVLEIGGYEDIQGPTPIVKIAQEFGFTTYREKNMPEDVSGNIYVCGTTADIYGTDKAIVVGDEEEYFHQRFIIAHELAHYLIDYIGSNIYNDKNRLFSRAYLKQNHNTEDERRADRFAAELLMPAKSFYKQYLYAMRSSGNNEVYTMSFLSHYFQTKKSSIKRRMLELGIS